MDLGIAGKVALVTAGSRGPGPGQCRGARRRGGAVVMLRSRAEESAACRPSRLWPPAGPRSWPSVADVADPATPDAPGRAAALERFGGLDIVVANAGGPPPGRALDLDDDAIRAAVEANLLSSVRLVRGALPHMRAAGWGRLCCISSYSVVQPIPTLALSNTARSGLRAWAKTAAADLAAEQSGITLNLVCPGPHGTDRMRELGGDGADGTMGDPADFGRVVAFVCSVPAGFVNGATIVVDGGVTLAL